MAVIDDGQDLVSSVVNEVTAALVAVAPANAAALATVVAAAVADQTATHRHYHTPRHLTEMLAEVRRLQETVPPVVATTIGWHDVVYDPTRSDNEVRSARRLRRDLTTLLPTMMVDEAAALITATEHHRGTDEPHGAVVHDADLWILSAPPARHAEYVSQVRAEYAHLTETQWCRGRAAILGTLRDGLAATGYLVGEVQDRADRTRRALAAIDAELEQLRA